MLLLTSYLTSAKIDIASQGDSVEEARKNLIEAIELFFEMASPQEILASWLTSIDH
ncbi:MAG: type II toxin-antitoxin system HicB family antitoxin [Pseudanabaena sp.]